MSNPLDTLASEAAVYENGQEQSSSLDAEEAAGGPQMPPAGQAGAALKPTLEQEQQQQQSEKPLTFSLGEAGSSSVDASLAHGDAAMAAVDDRLDKDEVLPHTNGYTEEQHQQSTTEGGQSAINGDTLDYQRVLDAATTGFQGNAQDGMTEQDKVPALSVDIDQPTIPQEEAPADPQLNAEAPPPQAAEQQQQESQSVQQQEQEIPQEQADFTPSMDSLPDAPAPLPSQLVNHTAPSATDASRSVSSEQQLADGAPSTTTLEEPSQPQMSSSLQNVLSGNEHVEPSSQVVDTQEQDQDQVPPPANSIISPDFQFPAPTSASHELALQQEQSVLSTAPSSEPSSTTLSNNDLPSSRPPPASISALLDSSAPSPVVPGSAAPIPSPSLVSKRPFEDEPNYFGDGATEMTESGVAGGLSDDQQQAAKRQKVSPGPEGSSSSFTPATGEMQFDNHVTAATPTINGNQNGQEGAASSADAPAEMDADGDADADADAEADVEASTSGHKTEQLASADASMVDQSADLSSFPQGQPSEQGGLPPFPPASSTFQEQGGEEFKPPIPSTSTSQQATPSVEQPAAPPAPLVMPKEQTKYALAILRQLKKKNEAGPFLQPVDPVALGIPHYPELVKNPMDMSTVEKKLGDGAYKAVEEFSADMRQIWQNCYLFNGSDSPLSKWANTLSTVFEKQLLKMPSLASLQAAAIAKRSESPSMEKKAKTGSGAGSGVPKPRRQSTAQGGQPKPIVKKDSMQMQGGAMMGGGGMGGMPMGMNVGMGGMPDQSGKPAPKKGKKAQQQQGQMDNNGGMYPHQMGGGMMQQQQQHQQQQQQHQQQLQAQLLNQEQVKFCKEVIKELFKKQHSSFAYPFYEPVDHVALNIPDYPKIIKRPVDLGKMRTKLENGAYSTARAFENDFKLLIQNCKTYNPPMTPVRQMGEQLEVLFYEKWQEIPQEVPAHIMQQHQPQQQQQWGGYYGNNEPDQYESEQIMLMQRQLELLTGNLEMLKSKSRLSQSGGYGGGMPSPMMGMGGMGGMGGMRGGPPQFSPPAGDDIQPYGAPPPPPPKVPRPAPAPRAAPKPAAAPKRKSSGSFSAAASTSTTPSAPKPRTTKRSSMAGRDFEYSPPARGFGRGGSDRDSDYEEEPEATVTFDMKKELADKIQEFDGPKLDKVVEIIRSNAPELLGDDSKEIELDIDMLDQRTLLKLYEYVVKPVGKGRQLKPKKKKVKGRNRGVDEVAEEERINALQAQLDAMQNNVNVAQAGGPAVMPTMADIQAQAAANRAPDVASSSSEEEDEEDGSESESDAFDPGA